jgi:nitroreductase
MNVSKLLVGVLDFAVALLAVMLAFFSHAESSIATVPQISTNAVIEGIMTRTSVRAYDDRSVDDATIETLLRAAMAAPTARNAQPWKFIVIKDKKTLSVISDSCRTMPMAKNAALAIVVCGDLNKTLAGEGREYWVQDTSAATENLLLAAHSLGLGAVWCGVYPQHERVEFIQHLLNLPQNLVPLNVIPIGYPVSAQSPKDKWNPDNIYHEHYSAR